MRERFPAVYTRGDLSEFNFKQRFIIKMADLAFYLLIRSIGSTLRFEVLGEEHRRSIFESGRIPIYALWHDRIFASTYFLRDLGIVVLTSKSFDGEYIARFLTRFGFGAVRGSSSRGGVRGLVEMIRLMKQSLPMAFTVDGPRGPRHVAKSGPVMLAKKTGNPILPFTVECHRSWRLNSWDRLQIPRPFSRVRVQFAEPIQVDASGDESETENFRIKLQASLDELAESRESWRHQST